MRNQITFMRTYGIRKNEHLVKPIILLDSTIELPSNATIFDIGSGDERQYLKSDTGILAKNTKTRMFIKELTHEPQGNFINNSYNIRNVTSDIKHDGTTHEFITAKMKLFLVSSTTTTIITYGHLNRMYSYKNYSEVSLDKHQNILKTSLYDIMNRNCGNGNVFLLLDLPVVLKTIAEYIDIMKKNRKALGMLNLDYKELTLIELLKMLSPDLTKGSMFNIITDDILSDITLILRTGTSVTFINLYDLKGLVKDYNLTGKIGGQSPSRARIMFLHIVLQSILSLPIDASKVDDIDNEYHKAIVSGNNEIQEEHLDVMVNETIQANTPKQVENIENDIDDIPIVKIEDIKKSETSITTSAIDKAIKINIDGDITSKQLDDFVKKINEQSELIKQLDLSNEDIQVTKEETKLLDTPTVFDKRDLHDPIGVMNRKYIEKAYLKDQLAVIYSLQSSGYLVEDISSEVNNDVLGKSIMYSIKIKSLRDTSVTIKQKLPFINPDGSFVMHGTPMRMRTQIGDAPIKKISSTSVGLTSYYGSKLFITKAEFKKDDIGFNISKQLTALNNLPESELNALVNGVIDLTDVKVPLVYNQMARYLRQFKYSEFFITLDYHNRLNVIKDEELLKQLEGDNYVIIGSNSKGKYLLLDFDNNVTIMNGKKIEKSLPLLEFLTVNVSKLPIEGAFIEIKGKRVPVGLLLSYYYGFDKLLKSLGIKYREVDTGKSLNLLPTEYPIRFMDRAVILNDITGVNGVILGGFSSIDKILRGVDSVTLNTKDGIRLVCAEMSFNNRDINEFDLLDDLFVDPITKRVLGLMNEPKTFRGLLIRASELLVDDFVKHPKDLGGVVFRGNERINGMLYSTLVAGVRDQNNRRGRLHSKMSINPYDVWAKIQIDSTTVLIDNLNPFTAIKQTEEITYTGAGGRSKETLTKPTRVHHVSEVGVTSEANRDSGDVGIGAFYSAQPVLTNIYGVMSPITSELAPSNIISTSGMTFPFFTHDDPKRAMFGGVQNSHTLAMVGQKAMPVRTGYETLMGDRVSDIFVLTAKENGKVVKVNKNEILVRYESGKEERGRLGQWFTREQANVSYSHNNVANIKEGAKFIKGETLAYDETFYEVDIFDSKRVIMKNGILLRTRIVDNDATNEDSTAISVSTANLIKIKMTYSKSIRVEATNEIVDVKNIGDKVKQGDGLLTITNSMISDGTDSLSKTTIEGLSELKRRTKEAPASGKIVDIQVLYHCKIEDISKTIRLVVDESDKRLQLRTGEKITGKIGPGYSIEGKPLTEGFIEIKYLIESEKDAGHADKGVLGVQLKCTIGHVFDDRVRTIDDKPIQLYFGRRPIGARIVNSPDYIGALSTIIEAIKDKAIKAYFE